jgi:transcriptional antiterminator
LAFQNEREIIIRDMLFKGRLGNAIFTANKLKCSTRTVERIIKKLRKEGHTIKYSPSKQRYQLIQNNHDGQNDKE